MRNILLTTDLSDVARKAYEVAAALAGEFHSTIHLVHDEELSLVFRLGGVGARFRAHGVRQELRQKLRRELSHAAFDRVPVKLQLLSENDLCEDLHDFVQAHNMDMIITSAPGRAGIGQLMHGSLAEKLVRHSPVPVLAYRRKTGKVFPRSVLVPIDVSDIRSVLFSTVRFLGDHYRSDFVLLNVLPAFREFANSCLVSVAEALQETEYSHLLARRRLERACRGLLPGTGVAFDIREGSPHREILREAERINADLILMAIHASAGPKHLFVRGVAEKVLSKAPCSVMTIQEAAENVVDDSRLQPQS
jgi:nucleotide-binding universal stress UspA family protein